MGRCFGVVVEMKRKLTDEQVIQARQMRVNGSTVTEIASHFQISRPGMVRLLGGRTYGSEGPDASTMTTATSRGSLHPNSLLDEDDVQEIRRLASSGISYQRIAELFGVSPSNASNIARGVSWKHVGIPTASKRATKGGQLGPNNAKLTEKQVSVIKAHLKERVPIVLLAQYFKVCYSTIYSIAREFIWAKVKPDKNPPPLVLSAERELPIRLRGKRLDVAFQEKQASLKGPAK